MTTTARRTTGLRTPALRTPVRLAGTLVLVAAVVAAGHALPAGDAQLLFVPAAQALAGGVAAVLCLAAARGRTGTGRHWRQALGAGLAGWTLIRLWWLARAATGSGSPETVGPADAGFFVLPLCALIALLAGASALPRPGPAAGRRDLIVLGIDSVLITASVVALVWSLVPAGVFDAAESPLALGLAAAYPVLDLFLATMAVLLLATRPVTAQGRLPLRLIAAALAALGVSDTLRLLTDGTLSPLASAGHLLGPALIGLAALAPAVPPGRPAAPSRPHAEWLHLLLPYVPVIASGVVIAVRTGAGDRLTSFEAYLGWIGLGLVVARQMVTIVDNTVLLAHISEGRQRLHHQAYHDPLTGLANRALFRERLDGALAAHREHGRPVALLFADLDDFKVINDSFGHAMGDRLLAAIGERLLDCVPAGDLAARLGGDEFAVLLEHHAGEAELIGHRMLAALRTPFRLDGHTIAAGASIGLVLPDPADRDLTADTLLRRADAAMYAGKRRGKGTMARYTGSADGGPRADLPQLLARALAGDPAAAGFGVHYQPIVRFADGAVVAVEALARWTDPVAGPVDPDVFVTVAERTGLVTAIDDFVLDRACADAAALANVYGRPIDVHVNVSAARLGQGLDAVVLRALDRHAVRPSRLVVEITETRRIPDLPTAVTVAGRLRAAGVRMALDDFGSGYNALAQLHSLPVDIVKLDSTLTDVDVSPERAGALVRSVLAICAELGITVVAEGIETAARAHAMADLGCPLGQGWLFGQPVPVHLLAGPHPAVPYQPVPARPAHLTS